MKEFVFPEKVIWEKETYRDNYGKIVIEPLERGYGVTIGNVLRRVLLSSIEGIAITSVKIEGVSHEFSTIPGVKEDVVEIIMNLKQVVLKHNIEEFPHVIPPFEISNKDEICAQDLINDNSVEVLNKNLHIATLQPDKKLTIQVEITKGRGYIPYEKMKFMKPQVPVGTILIDGIYSPIRKVTFHVENTRVGQFVDYEKLILEVWTTGAVSPQDAIEEATGLMNKHFSGIGENQRIGYEETKKEEGGKKIEQINLEMPISELKLTTRVLNGLISKKIETLGELVSLSREELEGIRNLGKKSIEEIENALKKVGCRLKNDQKLVEKEVEK
jgi:DNA-directed RNA polymerase subunit alpha